MALFSYKAKDKSGNTTEGIVDAVDRQAAASKIRELDLWPLEIKGQSEKPHTPERRSGMALISPIWTGVTLRGQAIFFRQLATMLQAGMMLSEALESLGKQRGMGRLPRIAEQAAKQVRSGGRLSEVMEKQGAVFSEIQIGLIKAGETGGMLDSMIDRIASYLERELEIKGKFSRTTFYPKLIFIAIFLTPFVLDLIRGSITPRVIAIKIMNLAILFLLIYIALKLLLMIPIVRLVWDTFKISVPVLGNVSRKLAMSRFSTALSVLYSGGIPLSQAVRMSSMTVGNVVLHQAIDSSISDLQKGGQLSAALGKTGKVPDLVIGMITTGERTGNLDVTLDKVSEYYNNEAETTLEKTGYLLFVLMILAAAVVVLFIVFNFYSGYTSGLGL